MNSFELTNKKTNMQNNTFDAGYKEAESKAWKFIESIAEYTGIDLYELETAYQEAMSK